MGLCVRGRRSNYAVWKLAIECFAVSKECYAVCLWARCIKKAPMNGALYSKSWYAIVRIVSRLCLIRKAKAFIVYFIGRFRVYWPENLRTSDLTARLLLDKPI
jgi:hypothetical protein